MCGHVLQRGLLALHHVGVEIRWAPHRLARVVDDEVEARTRGEQLAAERLDARRVAQVEAEDLEPMPPVPEIRLARVALRSIARKPGGHDELRARTQQLQPGLVADLHPPAGEERHAAAQVGELRSLCKVQLGARRAQLVVEMMDERVFLLADVAELRLLRRTRFRLVLEVVSLESLGREHVRRGEHRLPSQRRGSRCRAAPARPASPASLCARAPSPSPSAGARHDRDGGRSQRPSADASCPPREHPRARGGQRQSSRGARSTRAGVRAAWWRLAL